MDMGYEIRLVHTIRYHHNFFTGLSIVCCCSLKKIISCLHFHQVFRALEKLRKKPDAQPEEIIEIEKLIAEAYKAIDKTVQVGALHRNTGNHRKSRLARRKKAIEILRGWYVPNAEPVAAAQFLRNHHQGFVAAFHQSSPILGDIYYSRISIACQVLSIQVVCLYLLYHLLCLCAFSVLEPVSL